MSPSNLRTAPDFTCFAIPFHTSLIPRAAASRLMSFINMVSHTDADTDAMPLPMSPVPITASFFTLFAPFSCRDFSSNR